MAALTPKQADRFAAQMAAVTEGRMDMDAYDAWVQALEPQDRAAYREWLIRLTAGQFPDLAVIVRAALEHG
jgi:hypothetical protein